MKTNAVLVNMPVTESISENVKTIFAVLNSSQEGDIVLFPEGAISGYSENMDFLNQLDASELSRAFESISKEAINRKITVWAGSFIKEGEHWFLAALGFRPDGATNIYKKINLANVERGHILPGNELYIYEFNKIKIGVQLCRELRFPEQWNYLARLNAEMILHLNNAVGDSRIYEIWRSHLISRAAENQRYVLSVNNAVKDQKSPTMAVDPDGNILVEVKSDQLIVKRIQIDTSKVSNALLNQSRRDVVGLSDF